MLRYEFFKLDFAGVLVRYYLLMTVVLVGGFSGQWWIGLLALPIFVSAITGLKISYQKPVVIEEGRTSKIIKLPVVEKKDVG